MEPFRRFVFLLVLVWPIAGIAGSLSADQVKSAYIFNFIKFMEWPEAMATHGGEMKLCVLGNESLGQVLGGLDGRAVGARILRVMKNMQYGESLSACQVVVVGESVRQRAVAIIKEIGDAPVLTISGVEGFAEKGGCIGLLYHEDKVLFEVNFEVLRRKKLQLPGQVLNLATNVFGK